MPLRPNMELSEFLDVFRRRKWLITFTILLVLFGGCIYSVVVPEQYKSTTTIMIIPQPVPRDFVRSTVGYSIQDRLSATSQQILSRTKLLAVIEELDLFREERTGMAPEALVANMKKRISISIIPGRDAFHLSFLHEDPRIAMKTATKLAAFFIDENLRVREELAEGTSDFLETQLQETKMKLEEQEERLKQYKFRFMGELPQQMEANLNMLNRLQEQRRTNAEALARAEDRKVFLESQINALLDRIRGVEGGPADSTDRLIDELMSKQKELADLSLKYTDQYPSIVRLRREVEQLEEKILTLRENDPPPQDNTAGLSIVPRRRATQERAEVGRLRGQVRTLDLDILALKREREEVERDTRLIQSKVGRLPQREQEMIALTRDYNNLKQSYDDLLKKRLDAEVSQNLEVRQKGEQFQVLDPANLPVLPFKPDRKKILGISLMLAMAIGFGGAVGLEYFDPTLRGAREFKQYFEVPVLASIPVIQDGAYTRNNALRRAVVIGGILSFAGAFIVFLLLYGQKIKTILEF